jgi:RNA polymerase sigma-70 factor (ECF subfamily)
MRHQHRPVKPLAAADSELISAFQRSGDSAVFDELVRRHLGHVRAIVYPMVLNDAVADDLTQDTFLRAVRGLRSFRKDCEFSTWIYAIAMNCVRSYLTRRLPPVASVDHNVESSTSDLPESGAISKELSDAITSAMEQLSPKLRSAVDEANADHIAFSLEMYMMVIPNSSITGCRDYTWTTAGAIRLKRRRVTDSFISMVESHSWRLSTVARKARRTRSGMAASASRCL